MLRILSGILALFLAASFLWASFSEARAADLTSNDYTYTLTDEKACITGYTGSEADLTIPSELDGHPVCKIDTHAFRSNSTLETVIIPEGITVIGLGAFTDCVNLRSVTLPEGLSSIEDYAFSNCKSLSAIHLPAGLSSLGGNAFANCSSLSELQLNEGLTSIDGGTFQGCSSLTTISVPGSVTEIGPSAFQDCSNLARITLPNSITKIDGWAFANCTSLTAIDLPDSITAIYDFLFQGCTNLTSITIPENVTLIAMAAFQRCSNLTDVSIPAGVTAIKISAFSSCSSLANVYFAGTQDQWDAITIDTMGNGPLANATLHTKPDCKGNHTWGEGTVIKAASCKEIGKLEFTCSVCFDTKTEDIPVLTEHTYANACDPDCDVCGQTRSIAHSYPAEWSSDNSGHWHECAVCKAKKDQSAHAPGPEATETAPQTCTACGYVIRAALGHTHSYESTWSSDNSAHWHICTGCGETADKASHTPGSEATSSTAQTCTVCGYEITPALGVESTEPAGDTQPTASASTPQSTAPTAQDPPVQGDFPWWIIIVAVAIGGIVVFLILRKQHA